MRCRIVAVEAVMECRRPPLGLSNLGYADWTI